MTTGRINQVTLLRVAPERPAGYGQKRVGEKAMRHPGKVSLSFVRTPFLFFSFSTLTGVSPPAQTHIESRS